MFAHTFIFAGLVPFAVSAAIAFVMRRRHAPPQTIWAVAVAAGFIAGQLGLKSGNGFGVALRSFVVPSEAVDWLPVIVLLALGVSILWMHGPMSRRPRTLALAMLFSLSVPIRLLAGGLAQRWSILEKFAYLAFVAAAFELLWMLLAFGSDKGPPLVRPLLLVMVSAGAAVVLALSGVLVYGQSCGAVAAALTGTTLALWFGATGFSRLSLPKSASASRRRPDLGLSGAAGVITFSLGSLIVLGHFYSELDAANAILLFVSVAAAGGSLPAAMAQRPVWQQVAARAAMCLLPLAVAMFRAAST